MPEYLLSATSPKGSKVTERVDANSADDAVLTLHQRGYTEITLHTDDVSAIYTKQSEIPNISPSEYLEFRKGGRWHSFLFVARKLYIEGWKTNLFFLGIILVRRWLDFSWNWIDYANVGLLLFPLIWSGIAQFIPHSSTTYDKLLQASAWGKWQEVLEIIPTLEGRGVPPEELAFRHAQAVAALGRLPEALQIVQPFSDGKRVPEWLYWGRLGDLYDAAGEPQKMIPCAERAVELAPDNATVLIDLAMTLLRNRADVARAKQLLDQVRSHALSDLVIPFVRTVEALIALEEGKYQLSKDLFTEAYEKLNVYASANALVGAALDRMHAYLAIVESRLGHRDAAQKHFQQAEPRLRALRLRDLLQRCTDELGIPPQKI